MLPIMHHFQAMYGATMEKLIKDKEIKVHLTPDGLYGQDSSNAARAELCNSLPYTLKRFLQIERRNKFYFRPPSRSAVRASLAGIVAKSALSQSAKGLVTAGVSKSSLYLTQKIKKSGLAQIFSSTYFNIFRRLV